MATLAVQLTTTLGTNTTTLTYSATDAQRIFTAWQTQVQPGGTQAQFMAWLAGQIQTIVNRMVIFNETNTVTVPPATTVNS